VPQSEPLIVAACGLRGLVGSRVRTVTSLRWQSLDADITNLDAVKRALDSTAATAVVNFAAFTNVSDAWKQQGDRQGECYHVNVIGPQHLAQACAERGKYLIHVSTDYVYAGDRQAPYREDDATVPVEWYGQTKAWGEIEVLNNHPEAAVFRIASPFHSEPHRSEDIVRKIVRQLRSGTLPPMFVDTVITPTFVDDFARAVARAAVVRPQGIYNVVGATATSPAQLANEVAAAYDLTGSAIKTGKLADYLARGSRPYAQYLNLSNEKVRQKLGVTFLTLPEALTEVRRQQEVLSLLAP